jgi:uncharacterized membrane protein YdbT with pleckstrin-like domain
LLFYLFIDLKNKGFVVEDNKITKVYGIFNIQSRAILFEKVQNVETSSGILRQLFGLTTIKIWTSSPEQIQAYKGSTNHVPDILLLLPTKDSIWLRDFILSKKS